jgi:hypothetical protein
MWDLKLRLYAGDASEKLASAAMTFFFDQREDARSAEINPPTLSVKIRGFPPLRFPNSFLNPLPWRASSSFVPHFPSSSIPGRCRVEIALVCL